MEELLKKVRKMNWVLQESTTGAFSFNDLCEILSEIMAANVYITSRNGKVLGAHYEDKPSVTAIVEDEDKTLRFPENYNDALMGIDETTANLSVSESKKLFNFDHDKNENYRTIVPIMGGKKRWGTLILTRVKSAFTAEELVLAEYGATVVGLEIIRQKSIEKEEEERERNVVQMAIGTLSYSEIEAVQQIFAELNAKEGLLVASRIADRFGITRSVIVNALRKLESAGVIETRSLGMKGTHIRILNDKFNEELAKLK
jgi:transcriptional pleiotropic repressor